MDSDSDHMTDPKFLRRVKVSIIIPTFNRVSVVREAVASVLGQTHPVYEIIVVDDASTDDTCGCVAKIGDPRIKLLRRAQNGGGGAARHDGVVAASGDFIAFLDSDDIWAADKIERQIEHLFATTSGADLERAIGYTNLREMDEAGFGRLRNIRGLGQGEKIGDYIFQARQTVQTSTLLVATPLAKQVQFAPDLLRHQDWDFVMRAERAGAIFVYLDTPLVFLRQTEPGGRVSRQSNVGPSQYWLDKAGRDLLSDGARNIFIATEIMPRIFSSRPFYAVGWITWASIRGILPRKRAPRFLARLLFSGEFLARFRRSLPLAG